MQPRRSERSNKGFPPPRFCHQLLVSPTPKGSPRDRINDTMSDNASRQSLLSTAFRSAVDSTSTARSSCDDRTSFLRTTLGDEDEFGFSSGNERGAVGYGPMHKPQQNPATAVCLSASTPRLASASTDANNLMTSSGSYTDAEQSFDRTVKPRSSAATLSLPPGVLVLQPREATSLANQTPTTMRSTGPRTKRYANNR